MTNAVIAQGLARQSERPDIHRKVEKLVNIQAGYPQYVVDMVRDLKENVPALSIRQLSVLVGISTKAVFNALDSATEQKEWSPDDNPASCAASLAALTEHHPGGFEVVTIDKDDPDERHIFLSAPDFRDTYRRADQSHTFKRPITLASRPFSVAA